MCVYIVQYVKLDTITRKAQKINNFHDCNASYHSHDMPYWSFVEKTSVKQEHRISASVFKFGRRTCTESDVPPQVSATSGTPRAVSTYRRMQLIPMADGCSFQCTIAVWRGKSDILM